MDFRNMTFCVRAFVLFLGALCWAGSSIYAQPDQLDFRQFTTDDGLPSSEIYTVIQDGKGFIWVGTDNGLARFDGYEFTVYDVDDGLEDAVVFTIVIDENETLWVSTLSGRVFYLKGDRFFPYEYNDELNAARGRARFVHLIDVTPEGAMVFSVSRWAKIFLIDSTGHIETLSGAEKNHLYTYESPRGEATHNRSVAHNYSVLREYGQEDTITVETYTGGKWMDSGRFQFQENVHRSNPYFVSILYREKSREISIAYASSIYSIKNGEARVIRNPDQKVSFNFAIPSSVDNHYWAFLAHGGGLGYYVYDPKTDSASSSNYFEGRSLSSGIFDRKGGLWITSLDAGLFYVPSPQQRLYLKDSQQENAKPTCVAGFGDKGFYAGYDDGTIFVYHDGDERLNMVSRVPPGMAARVSDLLFDEKTSRVYSSFNEFDHPLSKANDYQLASGEPRLDMYQRRGVDGWSFKKLNKPDFVEARTIYASSGSMLRSLNLDEHTENATIVRFDGLHSNYAQVIGVDWDGKMQIGTVKGLYVESGEEEWKKEDFGIPALNNRVVDIQNLPGRAMLYGTRGNGLVYVNQDTSFSIRKKDGLASDMVRNLDQDEHGNIWVSTLTGFSKVSFNGATPRVRTFRREHGLPSNEVYKSDAFGEDIWLATSAGVVRFVEPPVDSFSPAPRIRSVLIDGEKRTSVTNFELPAGKHDVAINFSTINFIQGGKIEYRYRYDELGPWRYTEARVANYSNLGAGNYAFEVESKNPDGYWSEPARLSFSIETPLHETWVARLGGVVILLLALSGYFLLREQRRKREQDLLFQITQLEHAALHAQMNPHFVFNALNSIQNFVLENDAKQAATYLSRFARVIRQTLRSSVDGRHHLGDELMMLETYLGLEKLRFKKGFSYTIEVDPSLPKQDIILPPLLIQPFVENAIIHGLKDRKKGGQISVYFTGTVDNLVVVIEDNGKGFKPDESTKPDSLGMDITRRRLEMMNRGSIGASGMEVLPLVSEAGVPCGTRVTLYIRPLTSTAPAPALG